MAASPQPTMTNRLLTWLPAALLAAATLPTAFAADAEPTTKKELPPIYVNANDSAVVSENDLVGPYKAPEWTTARRFPTTRVYIQRAPGEVAFEQWWRARTYDDGPSKH